ncbi:MAG: hypothetical protein JWM04_1794 [Verrucomicrobiales bacterium]|nr:hypothetical protein [Verrucomicrobiales bacterium]
MRKLASLIVSLALVGAKFTLLAQNTPAIVKGTLPPPGIVVPDEAKASLRDELESLGKKIESSRNNLAVEESALLPDIEIYAKAVRYALNNNEFYKSNEINTAHRFLKTGANRLAMLESKTPDWITKTGAVVRGYLSKVDGSVQPFGLIVPLEFQKDPQKPLRLDCWFHGRGDTLTEISFMDEREKRMGEFTPVGTIVLHLYGRYSNASKFAGETDLFEALEEVKKHYPIDENKISIRGFSMGGATSWHIGAHFAGLWAGVAPGAGFVETPVYLKLKVDSIPVYEQQLWHLYNSTDYALNLFNTKVIAYSGEIDPQKAAADTMATAMKKEGLPLRHIIGPATAHKYEPNAKKQLAEEFDAIANQGMDPFPKEVRFQTWTLRYNTMKWVTIDQLQEHWKEARIIAKVTEKNKIEITLTNITALSLRFPKAFPDIELNKPVSLKINGEGITAAANNSTISLRLNNQKWEAVDTHPKTLAKKHGLQGPIDDAFYEPFMFVHATGMEPDKAIAEWTSREEKRAIEQWRSQFRGDVRIKNDTEVTASDIEKYHLVLWGTPSNNSIIAKVSKKLPIQWTPKDIQSGNRTFPADKNVPVLIYPNPLNENKYIILNSGFTFREFGSNANQTPKLPDYAILDVSQDGGPKYAGKVVEAGFFDESWKLK